MVEVKIVREHTNERFLTTEWLLDKAYKKAIIEHGARVAGECYDEEGWKKLAVEPLAKTEKRERLTLGLEGAPEGGNERSTPYEHIGIGLEITGPKILMMALNNERQYSTSEKLERYTIFRSENGVSEIEVELYEKWLGIYHQLIDRRYGDTIGEKWTKKLAQENARYLTSVFTQTKMIHTVPWIQLNKIVGFMKDFAKSRENEGVEFREKVADVFMEFVSALEKLDLLDARAMSNRKHRKLSLFSDRSVANDFRRDVYSTSYLGSFAQLAQAQRHRTLSYSMQIPTETHRYYVPLILDDYHDTLREEWLADMAKVSYPQGELVHINEAGTVDDFILKCKERLCSATQAEIMRQTRLTLHSLHARVGFDEVEDCWPMEPYLMGARCTFPDYNCNSPCGWAEAINLSRVV